ncbi:MAG: tRNA (5-methylaminomethyl-2-thiouridine)(34)-methyltransferase MnmD [Cytophagales bacterium]
MESILEPAAIDKAGVELQIIPTADHSHTLFSPAYNETYHSKHGAVQESLHVFVKYGLLPLLETKVEITIFEMGLGTGLNAMFTLEHSQPAAVQIHYHGLEKHPIDISVVDRLNYTNNWDDLETKLIFKKLHNLPWNETAELTPFFNFTKLKNDIFDFTSPDEQYDLIYHHAFTPVCQPELWESEILEKFYKMMKKGGVLVTYCAQGQFKRNLKDAGFLVESLPGPVGKREMTRAKKV